MKKKIIYFPSKGQCAHGMNATPLLEPLEITTFPGRVKLLCCGYIHVAILTDFGEVSSFSTFYFSIPNYTPQK